MILRRRINQCFGPDRGGLHRALGKLWKGNGQPEPARLSAFQALLDASVARMEQRRLSLPKPLYPAELPVVEARSEILSTIKNHQVTVICGETGSGKTTQLPKMCMELGRGVHGFIGHTQPRRIAARSVAARIAGELGSTVGGVVGFKVRFSDQVSTDSYLKLMTDGILLSEIQHDRWLNQYDTLIIDEAHERSLNIDFLLGVLKQLLVKRPDLKLIITSATIDPERFSTHFDNAPIIRVEGRTWPVETRYQPLLSSLEGSGEEPDLVDALVTGCETLIAECRGQRGDVLVFLPGERHIRECSEVLQKHQAHSKHLAGVEVLPLFARLTPAEQGRIFAQHSKRRIVLATNVAETSLTVPGIRYVIDTGLARLSRYSLRSKVQRLPIEKISRASANQRKGRCGREAPGICIRLYSEEDFNARPEFTEPEIVRTNLASVILQMAALRLGEVERFPFVEAPDGRLIRDGYQLLFELGAVNKQQALTPLGRQLAKLPLEPRFARMLFAAGEEGCVSEVLTIVSALSVLDPRDRPQDKQQAADQLHAEFNQQAAGSVNSDFDAWLNLWAFIDVQWQALSRSKFRKMCQSRFLSYLRVREWQDVRRQLQRQVGALGLRENSEPAHYAAIHRSLLGGLLSNVCMKDEKRQYLGSRNRRLKIFPGSALRNKTPQWLVAADISETSQLFARTVAKVEVEWVERLAGHLLKYSYSQPRWEKRRGQVGAKQKSTLYGLVINPGKWINYGPVNAAESREIFIRDGLVAGQLSSNAGFYRHNLALIDEVLQLEHKSRRRDILVSPEELVRFYAGLIPDDVYSMPTFERWRKAFEAECPRGLYFEKASLMHTDDDVISDTDFPNHLEIGSAVFPLSYAFSPGSGNDGVTMTIPVAVLNRVDAAVCEWLVPGLLLEKVTALIKSLAKPLRRNFVPAPDFARQCIAMWDVAVPPTIGLYSALARALSSTGRCKISPHDFEIPLLATHLSMRFEIIDAHGKLLASGRDLDALSRQFATQTASSLSKIVAPTLEREAINDWNFGDLPTSVEVQEGSGKSAVKLLAYPALCEQGEDISLRVFPTQAAAAGSMHNGLRALYQRVLKNEHRYILNRLPGMDALSLIYAPFGSGEALRQDLSHAAFVGALMQGKSVPHRRDDFYQVIAQHQKDLLPLANTLLELLDTSLRAYRQLARRIGQSNRLSWVEPLEDIHGQLALLFAPGFIGKAGATWLKRYPVYLKAIERRLDAIDKSPEQDRLKRAGFLPLWQQFRQRLPVCGSDAGCDERHMHYRWRMEELRISLFAQSLGTCEKVSLQRLERDLEGFADV